MKKQNPGLALDTLGLHLVEKLEEPRGFRSTLVKRKSPRVVHLKIDKLLVTVSIVFLSLSINAEEPKPDSLQVIVAPSTRYSISVPSGSKIVRAPIEGQVYHPMTPLPMCAPKQVVHPECQLEPAYQAVLDAQGADPGAFSIVQYPNSRLVEFGNQMQTVANYDYYLRDYGFAGLTDESRNHPAAWEPDLAKKRALTAAIEVLQSRYVVVKMNPLLQINFNDASALLPFRKLLSAAIPSQPLAPELRRDANEVMRMSGLSTDLTNDAWISIFNRAAIDIQRSSIQGEYIDNIRVSNTLLRNPQLRPNDLRTAEQVREPLLGPSHLIGHWNPNLIQLRIGGLLSGMSDGSVKQFFDYWTKVSKYDVANDADTYFLGQIAHNGDDAKTTLDKLLKDGTSALASLAEWRSVANLLNSTIVGDQNATKTTDAIKSALKSAGPDLDSPKGLELDSFSFWLTSYNNPLARSAVQFFADHELAQIPVYQGQYVEIWQQGQNYLNIVTLVPRIYRDDVLLPTRPGSISQNLSDPFNSTISPYASSLDSVFESPYFDNDQALNQFYASFRSLGINQEELTTKMEQQAPQIQSYARNLAQQLVETINYQRNGHISVPEDSIAEKVNVSNGDLISDESHPIAIIRPAYRYTLRGRVDGTVAVTQRYMPGNKLKINLACDGSIPTSAKQKEGMLVKNDAKDLITGLEELRRQYLASTTFVGTVLSNTPVANGDQSSPSVISISLSVPTNARRAVIPVGWLKNSSPKEIRSLLTELGFTVRSVGGSQLVLNLDYGPFEIGERCVATPISNN